MENKEFFKQLSDLVRQGAGADEVRELVFDARKQTQMEIGDDAFRMDTLSGDLVVDGDLRDLASDIAGRRKATIVSAKNSTAIARRKGASVADLVKHAKGSPAEAMLKIIKGGNIFGSQDLSQATVYCEAANKKLAKLSPYFANLDGERFDGVENPEDRPVAEFLTRSIKYFDGLMQRSDKQVNGKPQPYNSILPLVGTAVLARTMFTEDQSDLVAVRAADAIEDFVESFIVEFVDKRLKDEKKESTESVVMDSVKMVDKLLWIVDQNEKKLTKAPKYSELDDKYKVAEKYLHDLTLYRVLFETTQNVDQTLSNLKDGSENALSCVGAAGKLVSIFEKSRNQAAQNSVDRVRELSKKYSGEFALLYALATNNGPVVLDMLSNAKSDLEMSVIGIMAIRYSGAKKEDAAQLAEALGDVYGEAKARNNKKFADIVKQRAEQFIENLKNVREEQIAKAEKDASFNSKSDKEAIASIKGALAELDQAANPSSPKPATKQTLVVASGFGGGPKTKKPLTPEQERKQLFNVIVETIANRGAGLLSKTKTKNEESTLSLARTGLEFSGKFTSRIRTAAIRDGAVSDSFKKKVSQKTVDVIDIALSAELPTTGNGDKSLEEIATETIKGVFEID